jgi:O-antigen/teichoic acid export membrane protein
MTEPAAPGDNSRISVKGYRRVAGRASWTVIDQAVLALSQFAANLVLALWLSPTEYGGYVAATAVFWISSSVYTGLLTEPMMVFGSGRFNDRPSSYFAALVVFHWCISAMISLALAATGMALTFCGSTMSGISLLGYAVAAPVTLLLLLLRRTFYLWSHPRLSAAAGGVYMLAMFAILYALYRSATLSSFTAPLAAAGASALAVATIIVMRRFQLWSPWRGDFMWEVAAAHWCYGRWSVVTGFVTWARGGLYYLVVPVLVGLEANAALNVLANLVMPAVHLNWASTLLLTPAFSRIRRDRRSASLMWTALLVLMAGASLYALLIALFGGPLIDLVYRGRYTQYTDLAWLMGLIVLPEAAVATLGPVLRAHERPDRELSAYVASAAVSCVGIAAIAKWGLVGAIVGLLAAHATTMLVQFWWVLRTLSAPEPRAAPSLSARSRTTSASS